MKVKAAETAISKTRYLVVVDRKVWELLKARKNEYGASSLSQTIQMILEGKRAKYYCDICGKFGKIKSRKINGVYVCQKHLEYS